MQIFVVMKEFVIQNRDLDLDYDVGLVKTNQYVTTRQNKKIPSGNLHFSDSAL